VKVLNLYAGLGGNRKLWTNVEVTAVELEPNIAAIYQRLNPDDTVIVGDAQSPLLFSGRSMVEHTVHFLRFACLFFDRQAPQIVPLTVRSISSPHVSQSLIR